jgi:hypothetical protein
MSLSCDELYIGNSMTVRLLNLEVGGEPQSGATVTVTVTLKDSSNNVVSGASALSMAYVGGDDLAYEGILPHTLSLTENGRYQVEVTATIADVGVGFWDTWKVAKRRKCA